MDAEHSVTVASYCRVSTESQKNHGLGLACQQDEISKWLTANSQFKLFKAYVDPGFSGTLAERPALQEILRDAAAKRFTRLVIARYDRLSRDLLLLLEIERSLTRAGVEIISLAESFGPNSDPAAVLMKQVCGAVAQLDRARVCQRLRDGRLRKLSEGRHASGPAPMGYKISRTRELEIDPDNAAVVKKIFRWRFGRRSYGWIAKSLNDEGIKPPKGGRQFYPATIRFLVKNSAVFRGYAKYGRLVKGIHAPIL